MYWSIVAALVSVQAVGELMMNANSRVDRQVDGGDTLIALKLLLNETPEAIVFAVGQTRQRQSLDLDRRPVRRIRHEMFRRPTPVSVPAAPTVTVCATLRPPGPPNGIGGCVCESPC